MLIDVKILIMISFLVIKDIYTQDVLYQFKVKTSRALWAGTDNSVAIQLIGRANNTTVFSVWKTYSGKKEFQRDPFEMGDIDQLELVSPYLGDLLGVNVKLVIPENEERDQWKLNWIKIKCETERSYSAVFNTWFSKNNEVKTSDHFSLLECPPGHYINKNKDGIEICEDRNECKDTCNGEFQKCENYPGGYSCSCKRGYLMIGDTCQDENECDENTNSCYSLPFAECVNSIGSYFCQCKEGFMENFNGSCIDIDECSTESHGCQHTCINTLGSYQCSCKQGFMLIPDGMGCIGADKCKYNPCNKTTSKCFDVLGKYECFCKDGFEKNELSNGITDQCKPRVCYGLHLSLNHVVINPPRCNVPQLNHYQDECHFSCKTGYELRKGSAKSFVCNEDGVWKTSMTSSGSFVPSCEPKLCPAIPSIKRGYAVPQACLEHGITHGRNCTYYCDYGYKLVGSSSVQCVDGRYVGNNKQAFCVQIPKIVCPDDVMLKLPNDRNTSKLGDYYKDVVTNVGEDDVSSDPKFLGPDYEFSMGTTVVRMIARNFVGDEAVCTYKITVKDTSEPVIKYCPDDLYLTAGFSEKIKVEWEEPKFIDNTGIYQITKSQENGNLHSHSFNVIYNALDLFNNIASCEFTVNIKVKTCSIDSLIGGVGAVQKLCSSMGGNNAFCVAQCPQGKTFEKCPKKGMRNSWWCYDGKLKGMNRIPDCVDFIIKKHEECPTGTIETYNYRDQSTEPVCGKCPLGTMYQVKTEQSAKCKICPLNTYQDEEGSLSCKECPFGFGTRDKRAISVNQCEAFCPPGFYSRSGFVETRSDGCKACEKDFYSTTYGATSCEQCPFGTVTLASASSDVNQCLTLPRKLVALPTPTVKEIEGEKISIGCVSYAKPAPELQWKIKLPHLVRGHYNGGTATVVDEADRRVTYYNVEKSRIIDSGIYECEAKHSDGKIAREQIRVIIQENEDITDEKLA